MTAAKLDEARRAYAAPEVAETPIFDTKGGPALLPPAETASYYAS